ncbi:glucoamylase family protein [Clostridium sp.]|uniref:GH36-type glycosyl hydrolase domain-containing protein n=1 Tax=Clostridium sp. TaxID=1506 RepID=UPI002634FAC6|nr:glucoamylase family protein [Clostridium sp.]
MSKELLKGTRKNVIDELKEAFKGILHNHKYLDKVNKQGEELISSAEWILDNIYLIEKEYKTIKFNMPYDYFNNLPGVTIEDKEYPRIYLIAKDYIEKFQSTLKYEYLIDFIKDEKDTLTMGEIWAFPLMLRGALIINLSKIIKEIVILQKKREGAIELGKLIIDYYEKDKVDLLLKKLDDKYQPKEDEESISENNYKGKDKVLCDGLFSPEFIDKLFKILRDNSIEDERIYNFALDRLNIEKDEDLEKELIKDQIKEGNIATDIGININSLRNMDSINWKSFFEKTSIVEEVLEKDPLKTYKKMDFETKEFYRHKIEEISKKTHISEVNVVTKALNLAKENNEEEYKSHIGYYLIDEGLEELKKHANIKISIDKRITEGTYISLMVLGTIVIDLIMILISSSIPLTFTRNQSIVAFIIMLIPSSEIVVAVFNWASVKLVKVSHIPKLDLKDGIKEENRTIVIIPAIFSSANSVEVLMRKLEVYYHGNRDKNIYFVLLGDLPDSNKEKAEIDEKINNAGLNIVEKLNKKYSTEENIFYFLNRKRIFNSSEDVFMGYERKRGKLMEFMSLLKGDKKTSYNIISSDIEALKKAKYIITLDSDTFLPLEAAKKLIGAMSHPLNKPYVKGGRVKRGYSIMQPKITVDLEDKHKTYFSKIFAGDAGIDAYSTASSDVYQDLFKEGIFTGKGIIHIDSFYNLLKEGVKENRVLSHDLLEGSLTRCALISDVDFIDTYPTSYMASALRLHRWVRGDWQLIPWLFSDRLSSLSKWKVFDNLRRSLLAPSLLITLLLSLSFLKGAVQIALLIFLVLISPVVFTITDFVVTPKNKLNGTFKNLKQILIIISYIPYQSFLMIDSILRTVYRLAISKRNLLQWQTAAKVDKLVKNNYGWYYSKMWISPIIALLTLALGYFNSIEVFIVTIPLVVLWIIAPALACKISKEKVYIPERLEIEEEEFLRSEGRRIWAYYEDFVNKENNYLAPDNYQENPYKGVANRTSPTNIGMGLISNIVAYDLGYITMEETLNKIDVILENMKTLEKYNGHYLNWYDTKTKIPLYPRYISTVDSGNLLGYLWIIKETVDNFKNYPIIREKEILSIKDAYRIIKEEEKVEIEDSIPPNIYITDYKYILKEELGKLNKILNENEKLSDEEKKEYYWIKKVKNEIEEKLGFFDFIFKDYEDAIKKELEPFKEPKLKEIAKNLEKLKDSLSDELKVIVDKKLEEISIIDFKINKIGKSINEIMKDMTFKFLYDEERGLFTIGYNLEEKSLGNSYYDLMASEARIVSLISIARGEVPKSHWYNLSRNMTKGQGYKALASWSGTMFEYFMPFQIIKNYKNTLWNLTYDSVIKGQIAYGNNKKVPWGISESSYHDFDINQNYQYRAFGVPGIGLKRGLGEDLVISPYSSMMTLPYRSKTAIENLKNIKELGGHGKYGYIEAIDFTEEKEGKMVKSFMVHHLGMSFLALDNVLNNNILIERFHSIPEIKTVEVLLKERVPENITFDRAEESKTFGALNINREELIPRIFKGYKEEEQETLLLSNGTYSLMINRGGSGYSKKDNMTVYRWKGDSTTDSSGTFFYIRNLKTEEKWNPTYEPYKDIPRDYTVDFTLDRGKFVRTDNNIETNYEVTLSQEDNLEIRKIILRNNGEEDVDLEITSYLEVTLQSFEADVVHPGFSNLFINTEYDNKLKALIGNRRPRSKNDVTPYIFHTIANMKEIEGELTYETSRLNFIGRNRNLKNPEALDQNNNMKNTVGTVLDPIMSIRGKINLKPKEEKEICFLTGVSDSKEELIDLIRLYKNKEKINNSIEAFKNRNQIEIKNIGIRSNQANMYQSLATKILYINNSRKSRAGYIKNIKLSQEELWPYGISGDIPIILLLINKEEDIELVSQGINMHYYFKNKGVKTDLIIYNEEEISYEEPLQKSVISTINTSIERESLNKSAGVYLHNKATMPDSVKDFLVGICAILLDGKEGTLLKQLRKIEEEAKALERSSKDSRIKAEFKGEEFDESTEDNRVIIDKAFFRKDNEEKFSDLDIEENNNYNLDFFNGYGGFDKEDNSYVIKLNNYKNTPAPWVNVISNKDFGFHISEVGSSYTWCGNSRENKITPWSNDWVTDPIGEALYIKDKDTNDLFTITPMPIRDGGEYTIKHSFGYSTFTHESYDIEGELKTFAALEEKVKITTVKLKNLSNKKRNLSLYYYAQLVLGVYNYSSAKYVTTEIKDNYIYGVNPYSKYFGKLKAYLSILGGENQSFTGDRTSFIGFGEDTEEPKGVKDESLNNKAGSIYDPALVSKVDITIMPGEEKEIVILLGEEEDEECIKEKVEKYNNIKNADEELENVKSYWSNFLGNIQVKTPDSSMDYMLNGWLMYQTLSCRYLGRTAFYQSGGAYGFRDQLQDVLSIGMLNPKLTRDQILRSSSRQYLEGDVQHWWHPVVNSGIRTRFSDDLLWLPYVTIEYIKATGDYDILKEVTKFLEDEPLKEGEDERYKIALESEKEGTIYDHCIRAIERSLKFGRHGLPLMGSGDWNDGMSTVGNKGEGESVWVGWFLYTILDGFKDICNYVKDIEKEKEYINYKEHIKEHIEKNAWDGNWYRRAYFDDGTPLGSKENDECKIDSIAQSWSIISKAGDPNRTKEAMESLDKYLVDKENNLIKLLSPPFDKGVLEPGYIKGYVAGVRENGGQYTHAATWVILALTKLGMGDKAQKYFNMINPINHTLNKEGADKYKVEPYVIAADVYIKKPHEGRGGWSWYTGSSGWMYIVGIRDILGLKTIEGKGYKIEPCIPESWNEYEIKINNEKEQYNIKIQRGENKGMTINNKISLEKLIPKNQGKLDIKIII